MDGFRSTELGVNMPALADELERIFKVEHVDHVYTHTRDTHQDHVAACDATMKAAGRVDGIQLVAEYESPSTNIRDGDSFSPNAYAAIDIEPKLRALRCYQSQAKTWPHPRSEDAVRAIARVRGVECGRDFAEAFRVVRCML
jgi:LmbE family N-acetylglucosaminyl deacetylase